MSVCPSIHPSAPLWLALRPCWLAPRPLQLALRPRRTEFLPILQDFVPCRGRCPATLCNFTTSKKQGKGTADLLMPFGVLFFIAKYMASMRHSWPSITTYNIIPVSAYLSFT